LPVASSAYGLMLATRLGWLPEWTFN
jgi:hypothetical protein